MVSHVYHANAMITMSSNSNIANSQSNKNNKVLSHVSVSTNVFLSLGYWVNNVQEKRCSKLMVSVVN